MINLNESIGPGCKSLIKHFQNVGTFYSKVYPHISRVAVLTFFMCIVNFQELFKALQLFSSTFQYRFNFQGLHENPLYSSTFQTCVNPGIPHYLICCGYVTVFGLSSLFQLYMYQGFS